MEIKRIRAASLREAMRRVRDTLGAHAVILSNRRIEDGIEVTAAVDFDQKLLEQGFDIEQYLQQQQAQQEKAQVTVVPVADSEDEPAITPSSARTFAEFIQTAARRRQANDAQAETAPAAPEPESASSPKAPTPSPVQPAAVKSATPSPIENATDANPEASKAWRQDPLLINMHRQIEEVHSLLSQQLAGLAWGDIARRQPHRAALLKRLTEFGLVPQLALAFSGEVGEVDDPEEAWKKALSLLGHGLSTTSDDILRNGGIAALVGPTGVGKTTTVAKLSARFTLLHGPHKVALITTDSYRIGAYDQLNTYGMILKTPVRLASDVSELHAALDEFSDKALVLVDTAGMSQRDLRLNEQLAMLEGTPKVNNYVVLAANAQTEAMYETIDSFRVPITGCILTKLDEAAQIGGALSAVYMHKVPLAYISDGQRVPEELHPAKIDNLLQLGERLANAGRGISEEEVLALTFGRGVANVSF